LDCHSGDGILEIRSQFLPVFGGIDFVGDDADKNVLEPGPGQLEPRGRRSVYDSMHGFGGICTVEQQNFITRIVPFHALDSRQSRNARQIGMGIERIEFNGSGIIPAAYCRQSLIEHFAPAMNHDDVLAYFFGLGHHVSGEEDGCAATMFFQNKVAQEPRADRIQAAERLV
jgi:hypothetical protein